MRKHALRRNTSQIPVSARGPVFTTSQFYDEVDKKSEQPISEFKPKLYGDYLNLGQSCDLDAKMSYDELDARYGYGRLNTEIVPSSKPLPKA